MKSKKISLFICIFFLINSCYVVESFNVSDEFISNPNNQKENLGEYWEEKDKLFASDGARGDEFGNSVSIDGEYALVGANQDDYYAGSAYIFKRNGESWSEEDKLIASDRADLDQFGISVSLDGDTALIGANCDDDNGDDSGSAYIFRRNGTKWTQEQKLNASDGDKKDIFGFSVSLDGETALIGAKWDSDNGNLSGSAYVFIYDGNNWTEQAKLVPLDPWAYDYFGCSVSLDGDTALIGASGENDYDYGASYVFTRNGTNWSQQAKLLASDGGEFDWFGCSVSLDGNTALIGAYGDDVKDVVDSGSAHVFTRNDEDKWFWQAKLTASDGEVNDRFGCNVSLDGDTALIGADHNDDNGDDSGSAYVFIRNEDDWNEQDKLNASDDGWKYDYFGCSVSLDGDTALIGADHNDINGNNSGAAFVFAKKNSPPNQPEKPTGPTKIKVGEEYEWCSNASDPDRDQIFYLFDWGDKTDSGWLGPYNSSEECCAKHVYDKVDFYYIEVKVKDVHGAESRWSEVSRVEVPRNRGVINSFIFSLFERYLNLFPLLRHLLVFQ